MANKFYVTTPIYYPSAKLHIGHAYCTTLADTLARYHRMIGDETYFLTGTDEHGEKIQKNAELNNKTPIEFVDEIVKGIKNLWTTLKISNDDYIRTTELRHEKVVKKVFSKMLENGDIYLGNYEGWYCTPCESFWTSSQIQGDDHLCPDCGRPCHTAKEEAYFFRMSKYADKLMKFYDEHPDFITPESRKNEMINSFIKPGLEDLCVSRTTFSWGIQIEENPKHVVYVWLDALFNYISALGYLSDDEELFNKFWAEDSKIVHLVGNDITRFHVIYWPIFLMSLNLRVPDKVFVHGLLMMKDGKMSKSKGNVVDPYPLIEKYGLDAVRYYLVRETVFGSDGTFTPEQFVERINIDLANDFGNLLNRTIGMMNKYFGGVIPSYPNSLTDLDRDLEAFGKQTIKNYKNNFDTLHITEAIVNVFEYISKANKYIEANQPWVLAKDETKQDVLASVMNHLANVIRQCAIMLSPVLLEAPNKVFTQLNIEEKYQTFETVELFDCMGERKVVEKSIPMFPRLDAQVEIDYIKELMLNK